MTKQNVVLSDGERQIKLCYINTSEPQTSDIQINYYSEGRENTIRIKAQTQNHCQLTDVASFLTNVSYPFPENIQGYYIDIISNLLPEDYFVNNNRVNKKKLKTFVSLTEYINENMRNDISVKDLMEISNMSERSLYYLFKESVSLTPLAYIRKRKIELVQRKLSDKNTQLSITQLAMDFGFTNLGRFSNLYRKQVGELPSETRMKYLHNS